MTTSSTKTPVSFRFAPLHRHAPSRAPPIGAQLSIGLPRSNARLLAVVPPKITFTAVDAHAPALARTHRSRGLSQLAQSVWTETPFAQTLLRPQAHEQSETIHWELDRPWEFWMSLSASVVNIIVRHRNAFVPAAKRTSASDSHSGRNIGETHLAGL
jgi:hypothetical protein